MQDDKYWPTSVEAQLLSGRAGDCWLINPPDVQARRGQGRGKTRKSARHFFRIETKEPVEKKFGEWNEYEITCKGGTSRWWSMA